MAKRCLRRSIDVIEGTCLVQQGILILAFRQMDNSLVRQGNIITIKTTIVYSVTPHDTPIYSLIVNGLVDLTDSENNRTNEHYSLLVEDASRLVLSMYTSYLVGM